MKILKYLKAALAAATLCGPLHAGAANSVTVTSAEGTPGSQVSVSVSLTTDIALSALQISAHLGESATAVNGTATAVGQAAGHSASCGTKDGVTTLMLYSTTMSAIGAGSGEVARFTLQLGQRPVQVSPAITVKAIDAAGNEVACTASRFEVKVLGATAEYVGGPAYDFGRRAIRSDYTLDIPVKNLGTTDLIIDGVEFSSTDFSCVTSLPFTVGAGNTGALTVGYRPVERGNVSATVRVISNSSNPDNILRLLAQPFAVNEVHIGDVSGPSDTEVTVPISVNNMDAITGFTLEFELPSHLEYVEGSFRLSERADGHSVQASVTGNKLRATAYSLADAPFRGNDGEIASFRVRLSGRNSVTLVPSKAVLSALVEGKVTDVTSATYGGRISILYPQISVYTSLSLGRTPITEDAAATLQIRNYGTSALTVERLMSDGLNLAFDRATPFEVAPYATENVEVTLSGTEEGKMDGTVQIYSNDPDQRLTNVVVSAERYAPNSIRFESETAETSTGRCALSLILENYDAISALQFDLTVPEGFEAAEVVAQDRAKGFTATFNKVGDNIVRYFVYSLSGSEISAGKGAVLQLPFTFADGTQAGTYTFTATQVKLSSAQMTDRSSVIDNVTGLINLITIYKAESITISNVPDYIEVPGDGVVLTATVLPENTTDKSVQWSTSNPEVATVDANGRVSAVGMGTAVITATALGGDNVSASCEITVIGKEFNITFLIDGTVYQSSKLRYGDEVVGPEVEPRDGFTFSGWLDMPKTMPAHDVEVHGVFNANPYTAKFFIDDVQVAELQFDYGTKVIPPYVEPKEGYSFSGWTDMPETMPAQDIEVHGRYEINSYVLTYYLDDEVYLSMELEFGSEIEAIEPEIDPDYEFLGWKEEIPETMPAHDVDIHGTTREKSVGVWSVLADDDAKADVYTLSGVLLWRDVRMDDIRDKLSPGYYIIRVGSTVIKIRVCASYSEPFSKDHPQSL